MEVNTALGEVMDCMIPEHKKIFLEYVALQEELHLRMIELACQ